MADQTQTYEKALFLVWTYSDGGWSPKACSSKQELIDALTQTYGSQWMVTGPALRLKDVAFEEAR